MADYADLLAAESDRPPRQQPSPEAKVAVPQAVAPKAANQRHDVMTPQHQDINYRAWRDVIENTETHNSALRLTREERYAVEDMIQDLERKHKVKTSMNEVARLGILSIVHDYKQNKQGSLVYKVKKS
jgi:hypothetical protein